MRDFVEVADRVWVARHEWFDVNVSVVAGQRGVVVVDTHASEAAGRGVLEGIRRLGAGPVVAVVNTHEHFDHTFGNAVFRDLDPAVPIHAHQVAAGRTRAAGERIKAAYAADPDDPHTEEVRATRIVPADRTFTVEATIDLGDRVVVLRHPGRGHTAGDVTVTVPDADVLLAGDLVEESAPPAFGADSHPLAWPETMEVVRRRLTDQTIVVPGHGAPVEAGFVARQQATLDVVAQTIRELWRAGVTVEDAAGAVTWPIDPGHVADAVTCGYTALAAAGLHPLP